MAHPHRLERLRQRARHLPPELGSAAPPPEYEPVAAALAPLARATVPVGLALLVLAALAPGWTGTLAAALLAGVPGIALVVTGRLARAPRRRRVALVLATSTAGFLALATVAGLSGLVGGAGLGGAYQGLCCVCAAVLLAVAWPCWRRANAVGDSARAARSLFDEL
jgi:hypothetical protein